MLLAANADPNLHSVDFPPAILYALGYGRGEVNEDMAAALQGIIFWGQMWWIFIDFIVVTLFQVFSKMKNTLQNST